MQHLSNSNPRLRCSFLPLGGTSMLFVGPFILEHVSWCIGSHIIYWKISIAKVGHFSFLFLLFCVPNQHHITILISIYIIALPSSLRCLYWTGRVKSFLFLNYVASLFVTDYCGNQRNDSCYRIVKNIFVLNIICPKAILNNSLFKWRNNAKRWTAGITT